MSQAVPAFQTWAPEGDGGNSEKLAEWLLAGGCDVEKWEPNALNQLEKEITKGEASLHRDGQGQAVRVVSVAKPVIYDPSVSPAAPRGRHAACVRAFPPSPNRRGRSS